MVFRQMLIEKEKEIFADQVRQAGKPENIIEKIVTGKIDKYFKEIVLLEQEFVKDTSKTVTEYVKEMSGSAGGDLTIKKFVRYQIGK